MLLGDIGSPGELAVQPVLAVNEALKTVWTLAWDIPDGKEQNKLNWAINTVYADGLSADRERGCTAAACEIAS